jgi:hypothetical protein
MRPLALLALLAACTDSLASTQQAAVASAPWEMHVIGNTAVGADGHAMADVDHDGDADIVVSAEEASTVALYLRPADPRGLWTLWSTYRHSSVEDVVFCDLDGDGWPDIGSAGEDKRIRVARNLGVDFAPPVVVAAASNLQQYDAIACADMDGDGHQDLVVGGRIATAPNTVAIYILRSPTPWLTASWSRETVGPAGWTMHLEVQDVDEDGLLDVVEPDRLQAAPAVNGVRYWTRASGAWAAVVVAPVTLGYLPRYLNRRPGSGAMLWGEVRESDQTSRLLLDGVALPYPTGIGPVQGVRLVDLNDDGLEDAIWSTGEVGGNVQPTSWPGLSWLRATATGWELEPISGPTGGKWDEVSTVDVDADGKLDVVTTEQRLGLGTVWFKQP